RRESRPVGPRPWPQRSPDSVWPTRLPAATYPVVSVAGGPKRPRRHGVHRRSGSGHRTVGRVRNVLCSMGGRAHSHDLLVVELLLPGPAVHQTNPGTISISHTAAGAAATMMPP